MFRSFARLAALILAGITAFNPAGVVAQTADDYGDEVYKPSMGQAGKDVIWIPTPPALITALLRAARVTKDDIVYDLGAGDGRIPIAAAQGVRRTSRRHRVRPEDGRTRAAQRPARRRGRTRADHHRRHLQGGFLDRDRRHDVPVARAQPQAAPDCILKMKPGTRVTSHAFNMGDWEPDQHLSVESRDGYLWYVPAASTDMGVQGGRRGSGGTVTFVQRYQRVGGT